MAILKVTCMECGLTGTHVLSGDRGATSFPADDYGERCPRGRTAIASGDLVAERVMECPHLQRALTELTLAR